jgi:hypothetical protein
MTGMLMEPEDAKRHAMQDQKIVIRIWIEDTVELKLCFEYIHSYTFHIQSFCTLTDRREMKSERCRCATQPSCQKSDPFDYET